MPHDVLLDLDGTLVDPRQGFVASIRHALDSLGCSAFTDDEIASHIGPPLHATLRELLGESRANDVAEGVRLYRERYGGGGIFEQTVYPGIPDALAGLRACGARLTLATSKPRVFAERILDRLGLRDCFSAVHGSELDGVRADKAELIRFIVARESIVPGDCVMVGDRAQDIRAAAANGMRSIGTLWGYGSRGELTGAGSTALCDTPIELPNAVMRLKCAPAT